MGTKYFWWFLTAVVIFAFFAYVTALCIKKHKKVWYAIVGGVFSTSFATCMPIVRDLYLQGWLRTIWLSLYNSFKLFLADGDFEKFHGIIFKHAGSMTDVYSFLYMFVLISAPIVSATIVASFFNDFITRFKVYVVGIIKEAYIFSELSERSLALAKDIRDLNSSRRANIIFFDFYKQDDELHTELLNRAKEIKAYTLKRDISTFTLKWFSRKKEYFIIGENESENLSQAIALAHELENQSNVSIYVWARSPESLYILDSVCKNSDSIKEKRITLRRIDDVEIFVWNTLKDASLFKVRKDKKRLSILIVGTGEYGTEFLKTAVWMYQMPDIKLEINVIDYGDSAKKRLMHDCPELWAKNDDITVGEPYYSIRFIENTDIFCNDIDDPFSFENLLISKNPGNTELAKRLRRTDAVFVALGDDDVNIRASLELRNLFDKVHYSEVVTKIIESKQEKLEENKKELEDFKKIDENKDAISFVEQSDQFKKSDKNQNAINEWIDVYLKNYIKLLDLVKEYESKLEKIKTFGEELSKAEIVERINCLECYLEYHKKIDKVQKTIKGIQEELTKGIINGEDSKKSKYPRIYTPVYDVVKTHNISDQKIATYKEYPFNIEFEGSFNDQYKYEAVTRNKLEGIALLYHKQWSTNDKASEKEYNISEYCRRSSMAQAMHKDMVTGVFGLKCDNQAPPKDNAEYSPEEYYASLQNTYSGNIKKDIKPCQCKSCQNMRFIEHNRWSAFMRADGYSCPEIGKEFGIKQYRAKYHSDLIPYDYLPEEEKIKDSTLQ